MIQRTRCRMVPISPAAALPSCSTLTGAELPQAKKVLRLCVQGHFSSVQLCDPVWPVACQASLSGRGLSRQEHWSMLANTVAMPF